MHIKEDHYFTLLNILLYKSINFIDPFKYKLTFGSCSVFFFLEIILVCEFLYVSIGTDMQEYF